MCFAAHEKQYCTSHRLMHDLSPWNLCYHQQSGKTQGEPDTIGTGHNWNRSQWESLTIGTSYSVDQTHGDPTQWGPDTCDQTQAFR
jgi:hypothetical protein